MVLVQKLPFFQLFFLGNIGQKNVFYDILERENAFLGYKNKKFKKPKNWYFSMVFVQTHGFGTKNGHFSNFYFLRNFFFLGSIGQENVSDDLLEQKNPFLGSKNKKFKKSKNWQFSKGVNPLLRVQKWPFF